MSVTYKPGVSGTPSAAIYHAISVAASVYASFGVNLVITSIRDGVHSSGSLHYAGNAVDLRRWDLDRVGKTSQAVQAIRSQLGGSYDVILESDHIHIEYEGGSVSAPPLVAPGVTPGSPAQPPILQSGVSPTVIVIGLIAAILLLR